MRYIFHGGKVGIGRNTLGEDFLPEFILAKEAFHNSPREKNRSLRQGAKILLSARI